MNRVSARMVLRLLHAEATRTGDNRYRISPATLRSWVFRNRITRTKDGYCLLEIMTYLEGRDQELSVSA